MLCKHKFDKVTTMLESKQIGINKLFRGFPHSHIRSSGNICQKNTLLHLTLRQRKIDKKILQFILARPELNINKGNNIGSTPLMLAIYKDNDIIDQILDMPNININQVSKYSAYHWPGGGLNNYTALMMASRQGNTYAVKALLSRPDIHVNYINCEGHTAFSLAEQEKTTWRSNDEKNKEDNALLLETHEKKYNEIMELIAAHPTFQPGNNIVNIVTKLYEQCSNPNTIYKHIDDPDISGAHSNSDYCCYCHNMYLKYMGNLTQYFKSLNNVETSDNLERFFQLLDGPLPKLWIKKISLEATLYILKDIIYINGHFEGIKLDNDDVIHTALTYAVNNNHTHIVRVLLERPGIDINLAAYREDGTEGGTPFKVYHQYTPLMYAIKHQNEEIIELFLNRKELNVNQRHIDTGNTAFIMACEEGNITIVKLLLSHPNLDINLRNRANRNALDMAAFYGRDSIVSLLLQEPTLDYIRLGNSLVAASDGDNLNTISILLSYLQTFPKQFLKRAINKAFLSAAKHCHLHLVSRFLTEGANINVTNKQGQTALILAVAPYHMHWPLDDMDKIKVQTTLERLLETPHININKIQHKHNIRVNNVCEGDNAFIMAARVRNKYAIQSLLLRSDLERFHKNKEGHTAFIVASQFQLRGILKLLIEHNCYTLEDVQIALILCGEKRNSDYDDDDDDKRGLNIRELLCSIPGVDINYRDKQGRTAFLMYAGKAYPYSKDILQLFLQRKELDINQTDADGHTALMLMCQRRGFGDLANNVQILLSHPKINLMKQNSKGQTIFDILLDLQKQYTTIRYVLDSSGKKRKIVKKDKYCKYREIECLLRTHIQTLEGIKTITEIEIFGLYAVPVDVQKIIGKFLLCRKAYLTNPIERFIKVESLVIPPPVMVEPENTLEQKNTLLNGDDKEYAEEESLNDDEEYEVINTAEIKPKIVKKVVKRRVVAATDNT